MTRRRGGQDPQELGKALRKKLKGLPPSSRAHECVRFAHRASDELGKAMSSFSNLEKARHECDEHGDKRACKRREKVAKDGREALAKARIALAELTVCVARRRPRRKR